MRERGLDAWRTLPPALTQGMRVDDSLAEQLGQLDPKVFLHWDTLDAAMLRKNGFEPDELLRTLVRQDLTARGLPHPAPTPTGPIAPFRLQDTAILPKEGSGDHRALRELGQRTPKAMFALFGGRASRMKNYVKAVVGVVGGEGRDHTFLDIKRAQAKAAGVLFIVGTSPATDAEIRAHLLARLGEEQGALAATAAAAKLTDAPLVEIGDTLIVRQGVAPAIDARTGELFRFKDQSPYYYPGGHGRFFEVFHTSGLIKRLEDRGIQVLLYGNGDNLGQDVDDALVGLHVRSGKAITIEAATMKAEGGLIAFMNQNPVVLEKLPEGVRADELPLMNCNSFLLSVSALKNRVLRPFERVVKKTPADPKTGQKAEVLQWESVSGEVTWLCDETGRPLLPSQVVEVTSIEQGGRWRFGPIKSWDDLKQYWRAIAERVGLPPRPPELPEGV